MGSLWSSPLCTYPSENHSTTKGSHSVSSDKGKKNQWSLMMKPLGFNKVVTIKNVFILEKLIIFKKNLLTCKSHQRLTH